MTPEERRASSLRTIMVLCDRHLTRKLTEQERKTYELHRKQAAEKLDRLTRDPKKRRVLSMDVSDAMSDKLTWLSQFWARAKKTGRTIQHKDSRGRWIISTTGPDMTSNLDEWRLQPVPSHRWVNEYDAVGFSDNVYESKQAALDNARIACVRVAVHYVEVLE